MLYWSTTHHLARDDEGRRHADKLTEVKTIIAQMMTTTVITRKALRSFVGKLQSMAGLLYALRPFLNDL